ncbi:MAG TPA: hypothetical protein VHV77_16655 [Pirellulales bacterium]|jgi:hypothetical protein|nr:hypothetical protein [Pirellulales bacterium]
MASRWLIAGCLAMLGVAGWMVRAADPPAIGTNPGIAIDLKTQLEKGLRARRPVEFQYISELVTMIEADAIPRSLVDSTFIWARKQRSRQLQYFQFALKARADKLGIVTPSLKDQFVSPITGNLPSSD